MRWVLLRAFGPPAAEVASRQARGDLELARQLGLLPRIAHRSDPDSLALELDDGQVEVLRQVRRDAAVRELLFEEAIDAVEGAARRIGIEIALLKGRALVLAGHVLSGGRPSGDLDLLVPRPAVEKLHGELARSDFQLAGTAAAEHHLRPLIHSSGVLIELHPRVHGVRFSGVGSATWDELERAGELAAAPRSDRWPSVRVPATATLTAHAVVHVLAQHGLTGRYPGWLLIADLIDLGAVRTPDGGSLPPWVGWIARDISPREAGAALDLAAAARQGQDVFASDQPADSSRLARHFVAHATDEDYALALKARWLEFPLTDRPRLLAQALLLLKTFVPPPRPGDSNCRPGPVRRLGRWITRPFSLAARLLRALAIRFRP